jgi:hypothetical protein
MSNIKTGLMWILVFSWKLKFVKEGRLICRVIFFQVNTVLLGFQNFRQRVWGDIEALRSINILIVLSLNLNQQNLWYKGICLNHHGMYINSIFISTTFVLTEVHMKGYLKECCNVLFMTECQPIIFWWLHFTKYANISY